MAENLLQTIADEWDEALAGLGVSWGRTAVVVGANADVLAESLLLADSPPLVAATTDVAILGDVPPDTEPTDATPSRVPLPDSSVDVVVAAHAWDGPAGVAAVAAEANRLARPGSSIVLAELDLPLLVGSNPRQYPAALLRLAMPGLASELERRSALHMHLETELIRVSAMTVATARFDLTRGIFADRREHQDAVAAGLWRGTAYCSVEEREALGELVLALGGEGPVTDTEPWVLTRGVAR